MDNGADDKTKETIDLDEIEGTNFDSEYPLPKPSDTFLKETGKKALYTQSIKGRWVVYAESYKEAADLVVDQIQGNPPEDSLICPVVFMYRHYLEMMLKLVTAKVENFTGIPYPEKAFHKHELIHFWSYISQNINRDSNIAHPDMLKELGRLIKEFDSLDPDSMHYRYSQNKSGDEMPLPYSLDIENVKRVMQSVSGALELLIIGIDLEKEGREEMETW